MVYYIPFDLHPYEGAVTKNNIVRFPNVGILGSAPDTYFLTRLIELLRLGYLEKRDGEVDWSEVRMKILIGEASIVIDSKGAVSSEPLGLCSGFRMSPDTLFEIQHHVLRYEGIQDVKLATWLEPAHGQEVIPLELPDKRENQSTAE